MNLVEKKYDILIGSGTYLGLRQKINKKTEAVEAHYLKLSKHNSPMELVISEEQYKEFLSLEAENSLMKINAPVVFYKAKTMPEPTPIHIAREQGSDLNFCSSQLMQPVLSAYVLQEVEEEELDDDLQF